MFVEKRNPPSSRKQFRAVRARPDNPIVVGLQLIAIFSLLRIAMLATGVTFMPIPYVDTYLYEVVLWYQRFVGR